MTIHGAEALSGILRFHGRVITDEEKDAVFFNWTCSGFTVSFTGSTLRARLCAYPAKAPPGSDSEEEHPWIGVVGGDGESLSLRTECRGDSGWYMLYKGEVAESRTLRVLKLSENMRGKVGLLVLETDGEFCPQPPQEDGLRIEFVGDSITCGFGNEAENRDSPFRTAEENGWISFAAVAARELNAEFSCVGVSGISTGAPRSPLFPMKPMNAIYEYTDYHYDTFVNREPRMWDFAKNRVDVVVVNLGTNDVNPVRFYKDLSVADEEEEHFYTIYKEFIKSLRRHNGPEPLICCTLGPLDYYLYDVIQKAVGDYREESRDERICCFKLIGVNLRTEGFGAISHPSTKTHMRMGKELAARLKRFL